MMFDTNRSSGVNYYALPPSYYIPQNQKNAWMTVIMRKLFDSFVRQGW